MKILIKKLIARRTGGVAPAELPHINLFQIQQVGGVPHCAIVMRVVNVLGSLERITDVITGLGYNIVNINTLERASGEQAYLMMVLEKCNEDDRRKVENELLKLKGIVSSLHSVSASDSLLFIPFKHIVFVDRRAVIITQGMLREFYRDMIKDPTIRSLGIPMLKRIGESMGMQMYRGWISYLVERGGSSEDRIKRYLEAFANLFHALGYGSLEIAELGMLKYRIELYESFACEALKQSAVSINKCGFLIEGIFSGFFREMFGRRANVEETKCLCGGVDHCEYEIELLEPTG